MIKISLKNLSRSKSRSFLTSLGILIGVAAIVSLVSISEGVRAEAEASLGGAEYIRMIDRSMMSYLSFLDDSTVNRVSRISEVKHYTREIEFFLKSFNGVEMGAIEMTDVSDIQLITAIGIEPENAEFFKNALPQYKVSQGRMLQRNEDNAVLLTEKLAKDNNLFIGNTVNLDGKNFRIIGFFEVSSGMTGSSIVAMTFKSAKELSVYENDEFSALYIISQGDTKRLADRLKTIFPNNRISSSQQSEQSLNTFLLSLTAALWFVGSISAIVAGVGIMNTTLMGVMERIKEFGVLKAIGWKDGQVMSMICIEAILLGLFGGIGGIILGSIASIIVQEFAGIPTAITLTLIAQALVFSISVGAISSLYPAFIAGKMSPVEAVRYE
ncbi:MAG: ABC transporter permease [Candidatus Nanoarchaeia archaeon]|nr:ABC transporter permease [Candidatus Nanoarchaeia archaeon]